MTFEELLQRKGYIVYTSVGTSMLPLLRSRRDIIEIRSRTSQRYEKYDVVLFKRGNRYILHRVLKVLPDRYYIAGDNKTYVEKNIVDDQIIGVMTRIIRDGKEIKMDNLGYKFYVHLWCDCYPVRMLLLRIRNAFRKRTIYFSRRKTSKPNGN